MLWASTVMSAVISMSADPDWRSVLALTIAALAVALIAARLGTPAPSERLASILAAMRETPIAPRQGDPDAPGRPRPRAPTTV